MEKGKKKAKNTEKELLHSKKKRKEKNYYNWMNKSVMKYLNN